MIRAILQLAEIDPPEGHETLQAQEPGADNSTSTKIMVKRGKSILSLIFEKRRIAKSDDFVMAKPGGGATLFHALVIIFLEYFAWGLFDSFFIPTLYIQINCFRFTHGACN